MLKFTTSLCIGVMTLAMPPLALTANAQSYTAQTILSGLNNPRGLAFGPDGGLYVADAGVGGLGPSFVDGNGVTDSYGETGGVTRWLNGAQQQLINNLPSAADRSNGAPGGGSSGLSGIAFASDGSAYGVLNFGGEAGARVGLAAAGAANANMLGTVVQFNFAGTPSASILTDVAAYAKANGLQGATMPGSPPETNPYGITTLQGGGVAVTDAGGNYVLTTDKTGKVTGTTALPAYPNKTFNPGNPATGGPFYQSVPTGLTQGPDGTLYVAELAGYPFTPGGAHIDVIKNGVLIRSIGGFTTLIDVKYANNELYALALTTNGLASATGPGAGQLLQIDPNTGIETTLYSGLSFPGGLAIGADNAFYITNNSTAPGGGSVLRVAATPEPGAIALLAGLAGGSAALRRRRRQADSAV